MKIVVSCSYRGKVSFPFTFIIIVCSFKNVPVRLFSHITSCIVTEYLSIKAFTAAKLILLIFCPVKKL